MQSKLRYKIYQYIQLESFSALLLFFSAIVGLIIANSPLRMIYSNTFIQHQMNFIINDVLMAVFFFLVGCEVRREILFGELNSTRKILLPLIAAILGMSVPAGIYIALNYHHPYQLKGWAIPCATDIAFALGVLSLLGSRIPLSLKTLLMAIAIFDDIGAVIIITCFYSNQIQLIYFILAGIILLIMMLFNLKSIENLYIYTGLSLILWFCVFKSGIHPTVAGVISAFTIPIKKLNVCEKKCHPWVAYAILPLFAIINTGIPLHFSELKLFSPLSLGVILGLFIGKQLGIFGAIILTIKLGFSRLPKKVNYRMVYGMALLCGIGFTMSLFIGGLAFDESIMINTLRAAVMLGSLISGIVGYCLLRLPSR